MSELALRAPAIRRGVRLEWLTVGWMLVEGILAIGAGIAARSVLLTAFGADSAIELISGVTLLWRLRTEAKGTDVARVEGVERRSVWVAAGLLALLCAYVLLTSVAGLVWRLQPEKSLLGVAVAATALLVMPLLGWRKRLVNAVIQSPALRADIAETVTCAYMAAITLAGVALNALTGLWWLDYLAALALLLWLVRETREALEAAREGRGHCECD